MNHIKLASAALVLTSLALVPKPSYAWGIDFQDTYVNLRFIPHNQAPGFSGNTPEIAGNISYANGWTYGSNFVSLDFENFYRHDRANSVSGKGTNASIESFNVFRTTLSGNKISGTDTFTFGPIRDVGFVMGGNLAAQDDQFAANSKVIVAGLEFAINLPRGFWNIDLDLSKEYNNNAYISTGTNYNPTARIETAWAFPFALGPVPLNFTGFVNVIFPKGAGATHDSYHRLEVLAHPKLMADVGAMLGYTPRKIEAGVGFEYWHNKFGNPPPLPGIQQSSVFFEVGYHF